MHHIDIEKINAERFKKRKRPLSRQEAQRLVTNHQSSDSFDIASFLIGIEVISHSSGDGFFAPAADPGGGGGTFGGGGATSFWSDSGAAVTGSSDSGSSSSDGGGSFGGGGDGS